MSCWASSARTAQRGVRAGGAAAALDDPGAAGRRHGRRGRRKGLALLNTLGFALAAGLYQSASHRKQFRAAAGAVVCSCGVLSGDRSCSGRALMVLLPGIPVPGRAGRFWHSFSPLSTMGYAGDLSYRASRSAYWVSLAVVQAMAWLLLAGASLRLRRAVVGSRQRRDGIGPRRSARPCPQCATHSGERKPHGMACAPPARLARRPMDCGTGGGHQSNERRSFCFGFSSGARAPFWGNFQWSAMVRGCISLLGPVCLDGQRAYFVEARRTGELELLLTTPLGAEQIVAGQWRALKRLLFAPALLLALTGFSPGSSFRVSG